MVNTFCGHAAPNHYTCTYKFNTSVIHSSPYTSFPNELGPVMLQLLRKEIKTGKRISSFSFLHKNIIVNIFNAEKTKKNFLIHMIQDYFYNFLGPF